MMVQKIKKTKRKNKLIPKKNDKLTDKWFIGPTTGQGPKKSNLEKRDLFWEEKPNIKPNPFIKTMVLSQIYATLKYIKKLKKNIQFPQEPPKNETYHVIVQLSILKDGVNTLDIDAQLNYLKTKWIPRLWNPTHAFWKDLIQYWLNLIINSNEGLVLFRQHRSLSLLDIKTYRKKIMKLL